MSVMIACLFIATKFCCLIASILAILQNSLEEILLPCNPLFYMHHLLLKRRCRNADDGPFLFLEADSWRSGFQWAANTSMSTCVLMPDSWHAPCVPRLTICASHHVPVTWHEGSQGEKSNFIPQQRCIVFSCSPAVWAEICCDSGLFFSFINHRKFWIERDS